MKGTCLLLSYLVSAIIIFCQASSIMAGLTIDQMPLEVLGLINASQRLNSK